MARNDDLTTPCGKRRGHHSTKSQVAQRSAATTRPNASQKEPPAREFVVRSSFLAILRRGAVPPVPGAGAEGADTRRVRKREAPRDAPARRAPPQKRRQARTRQPDGAGSLGATTPAGRTDQRTASEDAREEPQRRDCGRGAGDSGRRTHVETQRARQARGAAHGTGEAHGAGWREGGDRMDARRGH